MNTPSLHKVIGRDKKSHLMTLRRKAARGMRQFADVTKPMTAEKLTFIRTRARKTVREAVHRQWILNVPFAGIAKRVVG